MANASPTEQAITLLTESVEAIKAQLDQQQPSDDNPTTPPLPSDLQRIQQQLSVAMLAKQLGVPVQQCLDIVGIDIDLPEEGDEGDEGADDFAAMDAEDEEFDTTEEEAEFDTEEDDAEEEAMPEEERKALADWYLLHSEVKALYDALVAPGVATDTDFFLKAKGKGSSRVKGQFKETDHPRGKNGQFVNKGTPGYRAAERSNLSKIHKEERETLKQKQASERAKVKGKGKEVRSELTAKHKSERGEMQQRQRGERADLKQAHDAERASNKKPKTAEKPVETEKPTEKPTETKKPKEKPKTADSLEARPTQNRNEDFDRAQQESYERYKKVQQQNARAKPSKRKEPPYDAETDATMKKNFKAKKLSKKQADALDDYQGSGYEEMNPDLWKSPVDAKTGAIKTKNATTKTLQKTALEHDAPHDMAVYTGVKSNGPFAQMLASAEPGSVIHQKGFISSSVSPQVAEGFGGVTVKYNVPKGSKGYYMNNNQREISSWSGKENEWLMPANSTYKIKSIKKDKRGNVTEVEMDLVEQRDLDGKKVY